MKITELIKALDNSSNHQNLVSDFEVSGISCNSKEVTDNFVFVAIKGAREDGNKFIAEAIENGAKAIILTNLQTLELKNSKQVSFIAVKDTRLALARLAAQFYRSPSSGIKVVGITGTNGKTTISYLIEALLKGSGAWPAVIGTVNYRFKDRVMPSKNTTPGPVELQAMLAQMLKEGIDYCIMEVSSHALDQDRTEGVNFHSAIFTNLTQDHLDYHKTPGEYFLAKAKLFKNINPNSFVVINNDDKYGLRLKKLTKAEIITYAIKNKADVTAKDIKIDFLYTEFLLVISRDQIKIRSRLLGRHNVYNLLAACAWALKAGIDKTIIKSVLERFRLVPGRLERVPSDGDFSVFVDYAHTEDALRNVLLSLRALCKKRIIVVFGCGGERDKKKRPKMGGAVSELSDYAIVTNDNPRNEDPEQIIKDIKRGMKKNNYCIIPERSSAIKKSLSLAGPGDIVLVAGKGHEDYQIIKDQVIHFDDREVIRECLQSMSY